jgi:hypothetical protein
VKLLLITIALCLFTASASACPNLSGHYVLQGEDGDVHYKVVQHDGCERVEIHRIDNYVGEASAGETQVFVVDGKPHGKAGTVNHWVGNRLQIGPTENHVYYELDSSQSSYERRRILPAMPRPLR